MRGPAIIGLQTKIRSMIGDVDIGANAGTQAFKDYLYKDLGLPVLKTTAKNAEAADDQVMVMLAEWCAEHRPELQPLFELVQEYRRWSKLKTTYVDGFLGTSTRDRAHPSRPAPAGDGTGRFAARNPICRIVLARPTTRWVSVPSSSRQRAMCWFPAISARLSCASARSTAAMKRCWNLPHRRRHPRADH